MASSGREFDPRTRTFSDEELKPQPMVKKSRKQVSDKVNKNRYFMSRQEAVRLNFKGEVINRNKITNKNIKIKSFDSSLFRMILKTKNIGPAAGKTTWQPRGREMPGV